MSRDTDFDLLLDIHCRSLCCVTFLLGHVAGEVSLYSFVWAGTVMVLVTTVLLLF